MDLVSLPRQFAKMEYAAVRLPLTLIERRVVASRLDDDAPVRLNFEKMLGSLDSLAGRLLRDDVLSRRGQTLIHRSAMLQKATELEAKADERRELADQELKASAEQAAKRRQAADRRKQDRLTAARRQEEADKVAARERAAARTKAEKAEISRKSQAKIAQAERTKSAELHRVAAREQAVTAGPKQQLADATAKQQEANVKRADADRLNTLATKERNTRQAG